MDELLKAVFARYAAGAGAALRALTTCGMWLSQAPLAAGGVYIVVTPVVAPVSYVMAVASNAYTQDCDIQFTLATLAGTATNIVDAVAALESLYDFCTFSMTGHTLLVSRRLSNHGPMRDDLTQGYVAYVEYRFQIGG